MNKIIDFSDIREKQYKEAFDWAINDFKTRGIKPSPTTINWSDGEDYDRKTIRISMFYDPYSNKAYMRRLWLGNEPLLQYNLITNFDEVIKQAPFSVVEMLKDGVEVFRKKGDYHLMPCNGENSSDNDMKKRHTNDKGVIDFNEIMNERYKKAYYWALTECRKIGIIPSPTKLIWNDEEDYDRKAILIAMFYNSDTGRAYLRREWLREPYMQYNIITNFDEVRKKAPKDIQEMLTCGLNLYDHKSPNSDNKVYQL